MHGNAADIPASQFDLAGMQTGAQRQADLFARGFERQRAPYRAAGAVECRENAVPCGLDQIAAMPLDRLFRDFVVAVEQSAPLLIAHFGGAARGIDDVGEHDRRQDALQVGGGTLPLAGNKFLDVAKNRLGVAGVRKMVAFGILDVFGPGISDASSRPRSTGTSASVRR